MPKYTITSITPQIDQTTGQPKVDSYGNKRYRLFVTDENGQISNFGKGYKGEPNKPGDVLDGVLEEKAGTNGTYLQFKAERSSWGGGSSHSGYVEDPKRQASIIRQNALTNAVAFQQAYATLNKKPESLTSDNVLLVAAKFAKFSEGEYHVPAPQSPVDYTQDDPFAEATEVFTEEGI